MSAWGQPPYPPGVFYPQGRRVFQHQILDDFSKIRERHTLRLGFRWLHDTITDLDFQSIAGPLHGAVLTNITDFFNGGGQNTSLNQAFPSSPEEGIRFNTYGGYCGY
jgi:hypothetical protein